jgi:adenylate cyclase
LESKALALDPDWTWAHDLKGNILRTQGRAEEAVAEHERALALDPSNVDAAGEPGLRLRNASGNSTKALNIERDPENRGDPGRRRGRLQPARRRGRGSHARAAAGAAQRSDRSPPSPCITAASSSAPATAALIEFRSVVDAVRCAIEVQNAMVERNAGARRRPRIEFRIGIHLGDVVEESDGDLMGDGVNIAARLEGIAEPGAICLSEDAYRQVKGRLDLAVTDLGPTQLKNIAEPIRAYSLASRRAGGAKPATQAKPPEPKNDRRSRRSSPGSSRSSWSRAEHGISSPETAREPSAPVASRRAGRGRASLHRRAALHQSLGRSEPGLFRRRHHREPDHRSVAHPRQLRDRAQHGVHLQGQEHRRQGDRQGTRRSLRARRLGAARQNRVRVNAQLIDAETGAHLWADRFEEDVADLFKLQDQVVARLANALGYELVKAEAEKEPAPKTPTPSISTCAATKRFGGFFSNRRRTTSLPFEPCSNRRSKIDPNDADALAGDANLFE